MIYVLGNGFVTIAISFTHSGTHKLHFWLSFWRSYQPTTELYGCLYASIITVHVATEQFSEGLFLLFVILLGLRLEIERLMHFLFLHKFWQEEIIKLIKYAELSCGNAFSFFNCMHLEC